MNEPTAVTRYASTALHEGETIKAVSEYLGHAEACFTLCIFTPDGRQFRTKKAPTNEAFR